jgi:cysteine desulfurase
MNFQAQKLAEVTEVAGRNRPTTPIYLDYQATTPTDPRVVDAMLPYFTLKFGNPHSRNHQYGWESEEAVEKAREKIGAHGADPRESSSPRRDGSNNLALKG